MKNCFVQPEKINEKENFENFPGPCGYLLSIYLREDNIEKKYFPRKITSAMNEMGWSIESVIAKEHGDNIIRMETYFISDEKSILIFSNAKCHSEDTFDFDKGFRIALLKAIIILYERIGA